MQGRSPGLVGLVYARPVVVAAPQQQLDTLKVATPHGLVDGGGAQLMAVEVGPGPRPQQGVHIVMEVEADGLQQQRPPLPVLQLPVDPVLGRQREGVILGDVDKVSEQPQVSGLQAPQGTLLVKEESYNSCRLSMNLLT